MHVTSLRPAVYDDTPHNSHFRVIVGVHELQSIDTLAFVQSLSKIPELGAVSLHSPVGSP